MRQNSAVKYLVGGLCAAALAALIVWLIRSEGERTRDTLHEATVEAGQEVREGIVEGAERLGDRAAEVPGKVLRDIKDELENGSERAAEALGDMAEGVLDEAKEILTGESDEDTGEVATGTASQPATTEAGASNPVEVDRVETRDGTVDEAKESAVDRGIDLSGRLLRKAGEVILGQPEDAKPGAQSSSKKTQDPAEIVSELFKLGHEASKEIDEIGQRILGLSVEEEKRVGREVHELVRTNHKILASHRRKGDLERLARPLLGLRERKGLTYTFSVLDDATINAFAHVGGYVYVTTGLLEFVQTDAELQTVVGHEIGHVDLKHCTRQITYAARAAETAGQTGFTVTQLAYQVIAMGYNEEYEFEADEWGYRAVLQIGRTPDEALSFYRRLLTYVNEKRSEAQPADPKNVFETAVREINTHFRTHPPVEERLRRLEALKPRP